MIKKKKLSLSIGIASVVLAFLWIFVVIIGISSENEKIRIKELSGQKVTYLLTNLKQDDGLAKDKKYISLILDDGNGDMPVDELISSLPQGITFGVSPYNKSMHKNIDILNENKRSFLINLPLTAKKENLKKFDIYSGMNAKEISGKIENLHDMTGSMGFYSYGNDAFLDKANALEATIKKIYDLELAIIYGVKNKTSTLESQEGASFKIKAFDLEVLDANLMTALSELEKIALEYGEAVAIVRVKVENLKMINNWHEALKEKNIELIDANALFARG